MMMTSRVCGTDPLARAWLVGQVSPSRSTQALVGAQLRDQDPSSGSSDNLPLAGTDDHARAGTLLPDHDSISASSGNGERRQLRRC